MIHNVKKEMMQDAVKAAPAVSTSGALLLGLPLSDWVLIATLVYTLMQIAGLVWRCWKGSRKNDDRKDA